MTNSKRAVVSLVAWTVLLAGCGAAPPPQQTPSVLYTVEDGEAFLAQGNYEQAAEVFESILETQPGNALCHYYLGVTETARGDLEKAEQEYKLAIAYDAKLAEAYNNLGLLLLDKGELAHAEAQLHNHLRLRPKSADAHYNYGIVLVAQGNGLKAKEHFVRAFELAPEDPASQLRLGDLAREDGDTPAALEHYRMALEIDPQSTDAVLLKAQTMLTAEDNDQAIKTLEQLLNFENAQPADLTTAGILLAKIDEDQRALVFFEKAVEVDKRYAPAYFLAANALARQEQYTQAAKHYERFLALKPGPKEAKIARDRLEICRQKAGR